MKNFLLTLLLLLIAGIPVFSQADDKPPRGYVAVTFGPSLSVGDFSDNAWNNDKAGYGTNGYNYAVDFGFKFIPNFGLTAALKGAVIPLDVQALADGYAEEYGGQFTVQTTRWGYTGFFIGPFVSIPTKYVDVDFRFTPGLLVAVSPEMTVTRDNQVESRGSATGSSLAFNIGMGARIHIAKKVSLVARGEYHISRPVFTIDYYDTNNNIQRGDWAQPFGMFDLSFGFAWRLF